MSKLILLLRYFASGRGDLIRLWPGAIVKKLAVILSLILAGFLFSCSLLGLGLFAAYQHLQQAGYSMDQSLGILAAILFVIVAALFMILASMVKKVKFEPHHPVVKQALEDYPVTAQIASQFRHRVQDAVFGFTEGFFQGRKVRKSRVSPSRL